MMLAFRCDRWSSFEEGDCWTCGENFERCAVMGYHTRPNPAVYPQTGFKYFLKTMDKPPYCGNQLIQ